MGEEKNKDKATKADGGDKKKKKDVAPPAAAAAAEQPIVLKVDLHCAGCASKVKRAIKHAPGVESVKTDTAANKVVVTGAANAAELKERIEARAKKPVQIVSAGAGPPPNKDTKENDKAGDEKPEKHKGKPQPDKEKTADKPKPKEEKKLKEETVTLKIRLHCDGCIDRIRRRVYKFKGVKDVAVDAAKNLVKVTGTMDAALLPAYLRDKLSRPVEVVAPGIKDKKDDGENKKDKGAGEKKQDGGDDKKRKVRRRVRRADARGGREHVPDAPAVRLPHAVQRGARRLLRRPRPTAQRRVLPRRRPRLRAVVHCPRAPDVQRREPQRLLRHVTTRHEAQPRQSHSTKPEGKLRLGFSGFSPPLA